MSQWKKNDKRQLSHTSQLDENVLIWQWKNRLERQPDRIVKVPIKIGQARLRYKYEGCENT